MKNYDGMTQEELNDEIQKLDDRKQCLRTEQLKIKGILDTRSAQTRFENMSETERKAISGIINANGVASTGGVGQP
jgi:hypothetical protein